MPKKNKYATNKDIAKVVRKKLKISEKTARNTIDEFFDEIKRMIIAGEKVSLQNFGTFSLIKWKSGEFYSINEKKKIKKELKTISFKPSRILKKQIED
ncbi:MAG: HU family DNA-binding protein [bacterium]